jgi:hypothetical protein
MKRFIKLYEEFTGGSSMTLPLGDDDKEKVKTALWDKLTSTPELKSQYDLSTTTKSEFFKPLNFKNHSILNDVKIKIRPDSIVLNIVGLGKNHEVKIKLDKALDSPDFKLTATFNLGNIFGYN